MSKLANFEQSKFGLYNRLNIESSFVPTAITQPFFELQTPDFAWKFVWIFSTNFEQNANLQKNLKNVKSTKCTKKLTSSLDAVIALVFIIILSDKAKICIRLPIIRSKSSRSKNTYSYYGGCNDTLDMPGTPWYYIALSQSRCRQLDNLMFVLC